MNEFTPKYLVVYDSIKSDIESGKLLPGTFLPTEKKLMEIYGSSRTTIRKAMQSLQEEHYVEIRQGRGTRVSLKNAKEATFGLQKSHLFKEVRIGSIYLVKDPKTQSQGAVIDTIKAPENIASALQISPGEEVYRLQRVKLVNGLVFGYVVSYIPVHFCPNLTSYNGQITNLYSALWEYYHISISVGQEQIGAINAGFVESKILDVKIGSPMILAARIAKEEHQRPVEYSESTLNPTLYQMVISMEGLMDSEEC